MSTAVVIGGGVSGLAAVYYLQRNAASKFGKIILLEASDRVGGWVRSTRFDNGSVFEHGPRSLRPMGESGINSLLLAEELGLTAAILPTLSTSAAAKNRFLYINGQIHVLPNSLMSTLTTQPPFSKPIFMTALSELFKKKGDNTDETVHGFVARRFGKEFADYAVDPMCRGIFAGNCRNLSVDACFPILTTMERQHGSVLRGMLTPKQKAVPNSALVRKAKSERWVSWSLRTGMQDLTDAMEDVISQDKRSEVRKCSPCTGMTVQPDGKIKVSTEGEDIMADHVLSAVYAKSQVTLYSYFELADGHPFTVDLGSLLPASPLREGLEKIPAVSVAVVNLEYKGNHLPREGFGHLLPSFESRPVLGVVYDSCTHPQHNRTDMANSTRLTVMLGGAWFDELVKLTDLEESRLVQLAAESVREHLNITVSPTRTYVAIQKNCIPQYIVGHNPNLESIEKYLSDKKIPLSLIGSSYRGPSVNDCIYNTRTAVENICLS